MGAQVPRDPLLAWRLTFLPDPVPMSQPRRSPGGLGLNSSILDSSQLTAVLGMARDMDLLSRRLGAMTGTYQEKGDGGDERKPPKAGTSAGRKGGGKAEA